MRNMILIAIAALTLSGCVYNDYGAAPVEINTYSCADADSRCARGRG